MFNVSALATTNSRAFFCSSSLSTAPNFSANALLVVAVTFVPSPASKVTAQEVAQSAHVPGRIMAKTVIVDMDGEMAMVVLPANRKIALQELRDITGSDRLKLASEEAEKVKVVLRGLRQDAMKQIKKMNLSEDENKKTEKQLQVMTDAAIEKVQEYLEKKRKDLLDVSAKAE